MKIPKWFEKWLNTWGLRKQYLPAATGLKQTILIVAYRAYRLGRKHEKRNAARVACEQSLSVDLKAEAKWQEGYEEACDVAYDDVLM